MKSIIRIKSVRSFLSVLLTVAIIVLGIPGFSMTTYATDPTGPAGPTDPTDPDPLLDFNPDDIHITVTNGDYDERSHRLVTSAYCASVDGYSVEYSTDNSNWSGDVPRETNAGEYSVWVKFTKNGYNDFISDELTATINPKTITGISISGRNITYDHNQNQPLVTLNGNWNLRNTDTVKWYVKNADDSWPDDPDELSDIPNATGEGSFTVKLVVERANYNTLTLETTSTVVLPYINVGSLRVTGYEGTYDGEDHSAVTVEHQGNYTLYYQLDDGDGICESSPSSWSTTMPVVTDAGSYIIWVKARMNYFYDRDVNVIPAESAEDPYNIYIEKASQSFSFDNYAGETSSLRLTYDQIADGYTCDFSATDTDNLAGGTITYSIELSSDEEGIATIDSETGELSISDYGQIIVKAELSSNDSNYKPCTIQHILTVSALLNSQSEYVRFPAETITYTLGNSEGIPANVAGHVEDDDTSALTYSITDGNDLGLTINGSGTVSIADYEKLMDALDDNDGSLDVTVAVDKEAYKKYYWGYWWNINNENNYWIKYPEDSASYTLRISYADVPESAYSIYSAEDEETALASGNGNNGWYNTALIVKPAEGYQIIKAGDIGQAYPLFVSEIKYGDIVDGTPADQGENVKSVYLKDIETGEITGRIVIGADKIDTIAPGALNVSFPETASQNGISYYGDKITISFRAFDVTSGVDHFEWEYVRENGAALSILEEDTGSVEAKADTAASGNGYYTGELTLPQDQAEQLRGNLRVVAVDKAGNRSVAYTDSGIFVVDTLSPTRTVTYGLKDGKGVEQVYENKHYFSNDVVFTFKITESNFYGSDVVITLTRNGSSSRVTNLIWEPTDVADEYKTTLTLSDDGEYVVSMNYTDRSGKEMTSFSSEIIVVDTCAPEINNVVFSSPDRSVNGTDYYKGSVSVQFEIKEINFYANDVKVAVKNANDELKEIGASWTEISADTHLGTASVEADHTNDDDYIFVINYTDRSGNVMTEYISGKKVIDTTTPVISVRYDIANPVYTGTDYENNQRKYYKSRLTATVTINEHNFRSEDVKYTIVARDVSGAPLDTNSLFSVSGWSRSGDSNTMVITYPGDANYTFDIEFTDMASNPAADYPMDRFTVDTTPPTNLTISYSLPVLSSSNELVPISYYNSSAVVTISATDNISGINFMQYSCIGAELVSPVNSERTGVIVDASGITRSEGGKTGTVQFELPGNVLGAGGQFNGNISFFATDRASNDSTALLDTNRIIVDSIHPTIDVKYNAPVQVKNGISYYSGNINASITIHEANFHSEDVNVSVVKNGAVQNLNVHWADNSTDVHVGTFTLTDDGDYTVSVGYTDRSGNAMQDYVSGRLTIDTAIKAPQITVNGAEADGVAFKDEVVPVVIFEDVNLDSYDIKLFRTNYSDKNVDVTNIFIGNNITTEGNLVRIDMNPFEKDQNNDGIYTLKTSLVDKSGNSAENNITFTVNRFGSVYEYDDYLMYLIGDGGAYVQSVDNALVIDEYNADRLIEGSLDIIVSRDGKPLENVIYNVTPTINATASVGEKGWYQYTYTIDKENFTYDGVYKISISSKDAAGNSPENNNYKEKLIVFRVDSTDPEITSISGLERKVINSTDQEVKYSIYDTIGLASLVVYIDGDAKYDISDFSEDPNNYSGSFVLHESSNAQKVSFVVTDKAGNITDTDSVEFTSAYAFNPEITVSTNFFVRWFANRLMFFGTIGGGVAAIGAGAASISLVRRRRRFR